MRLGNRDPTLRLVAGAERALPHAVGRRRVHRRRARAHALVSALVGVVYRRVERWLARQGFGPDEPQDVVDDDEGQAALLSASVAGRVAMGMRAGHRVRRLQPLPGRPFRRSPQCAQAGGYNLHPAVVIGAHNLGGRETAGRTIFSGGRVSERPLLLERAGALWGGSGSASSGAGVDSVTAPRVGWARCAMRQG
jgi:hypothetical protein